MEETITIAKREYIRLRRVAGEDTIVDDIEEGLQDFLEGRFEEI